MCISLSFCLVCEYEVPITIEYPPSPGVLHSPELDFLFVAGFHSYPVQLANPPEITAHDQGSHTPRRSGRDTT